MAFFYAGYSQQTFSDYTLFPPNLLGMFFTHLFEISTVKEIIVDVKVQLSPVANHSKMVYSEIR